MVDFTVLIWKLPNANRITSIMFFLVLWIYCCAALLRSSPTPNNRKEDILSVPSDGTVNQMALFAKMSAIAYCSVDSINRFDCKQCKDTQLAGMHSITAFNDTSTGVQG